MKGLILVLSFLSFLSLNVFAAEIHMSEKTYPIGEGILEKVFVQGNKIILRSIIKPCASYPGYPDKIYGDMYECLSSREQLHGYTKDAAILKLSDEALTTAILQSKAKFKCNDNNSPVLMSYAGKNVYVFSGSVQAVE